MIFDDIILTYSLELTNYRHANTNDHNNINLIDWITFLKDKIKVGQNKVYINVLKFKV